MTTENARSIEELLKLDSYADMSDSEIEAVIAYREKQAVTNARIENEHLRIQETFAKFEEDAKTVRERATKQFETVCGQLNLTEVK